MNEEGTIFQQLHSVAGFGLHLDRGEYGPPWLAAYLREDRAGLLQLDLCHGRLLGGQKLLAPLRPFSGKSQLQLRIIGVSLDQGRKDLVITRRELDDRLPRRVAVGPLDGTDEVSRRLGCCDRSTCGRRPGSPRGSVG